MVFVSLVFVLYRRPLTFLILVGGISGWGGIKMASASELAKNLILVYTVQPKSMIKAHFSLDTKRPVASLVKGGL